MSYISSCCGSDYDGSLEHINGRIIGICNNCGQEVEFDDSHEAPIFNIRFPKMGTARKFNDDDVDRTNESWKEIEIDNREFAFNC